MNSQTLCTTFSALSDPVRLSIVERLARGGEMSAGDIAGPYSISLPAISRHLSVLEQAGLVERRVDRKWRRFRLRPEAVSAANDWFERHRVFWEGSLDRLATVLTELETEKPTGPQKDPADDQSPPT